jgi:hypothetical protein
MGGSKKQVSPLRFASVEMTGFEVRRPGQQVSPLRYASVEMTDMWGHKEKADPLRG